MAYTIREGGGPGMNMKPSPKAKSVGMNVAKKEAPNKPAPLPPKKQVKR